MKKILQATLSLFASLLLVTSVWAEQGVTDTEILIGSNNDLSGPFSAFGGPAIKSAQLVFDKVNKAGGIHGRKIRFIVEDHAYSMPKAISGLNKLVNGDKVFAMLLTLGTSINIASFKLQDAKKIPNISPLSNGRQMDKPLSALHYTAFASYYSQIVAGVDYIAKEKKVTKICSMYLPTDYGKEIKEGSLKASEVEGRSFIAETTHKPDETDFVGALQKLNKAGCQIITMALTVRQAISVIATAKKLGIQNMSFLNSSAGFHSPMAKVPGGVTEGLYAAAGGSDILSRLDNPTVKEFFKEYTEKTGEKFPGTGAIYGYSGATTVVNALKAAGKDLTTASFQKAMESLNYRDEISDSHVSYSASDHQGADDIVVSIVENGAWKEVARTK